MTTPDQVSQNSLVELNLPPTTMYLLDKMAEHYATKHALTLEDARNHVIGEGVRKLHQELAALIQTQ
jgi:hypothetical protein